MKKNDSIKPNKDNKTVVLGMSGGIDSSVALFLLKEQGFQVVGLSLKFGCWEKNKKSLKENACCSQDSIQRAKKLCQKYNVPHFVIDCSNQFQKKVINYFIKDLKNNKTPNPCVFCNRDVKISALLDFAKKKKANYISTGHYARIQKNKKGEFQLLTAKDKKKDQSYFLVFLSQVQLSKLILPLGSYLKKDIYQIAKQERIKVAPKESQDLCFVDNKSMPLFLEKEIGIKPGEIQDTKGNVLGQHQGLPFYTRGQRKRIKLAGGPFWVVDVDSKKNILIVSKNSKDSKLFSREVMLFKIHFISTRIPEKLLKVRAKLRSTQPLSEAILIPPKIVGGSRTSPHWKLVFNKPQKAVTPGQIAVFYKGDVCLGGGIIDEAKK